MAGNPAAMKSIAEQLGKMPTPRTSPFQDNGWELDKYQVYNAPHLTYTSGNLNGQTMSYNAANINTTGGNR